MSHYFSSDSPAASAPREIDVVLRGRSVRVTTDRGVFSGDRLDPGTAVLLSHVPDPPPTGTVLDLGCGWGPIALSLAAASPQARVIGVDVNPRALALTSQNATALGLAVEVAEPDALLAAEPDLALDLLWSNPPIRVGKDVLHAMLRTWLPRLAPDGVAHLVVSKNLGADSLQRWIAAELGLDVTRTASSKGFRVLSVAGAAR
ncbi:class I SAM-dependent methyltransferase [Pseudactinotalea sp.]|uniref:class I SAM-dependent methyltransferase n=1 Tax=Pseudactinotalea sp. TaxID=1926260 RepID=UPI003B3B2EC8